MVAVVVPFRAGGKSRLPEEIRAELALAMLGDVLDAATSFAPTRLVTDDPAAALVAHDLGAEVVDDPGDGQGPAVCAALFSVTGPALVVNADLPCVTSAAMHELAACGSALVAAADGTTNALSLPAPQLFRPLYGPGSAERFAALGLVPVSIPSLERDVDTIEDLDGLILPPGRRTRLVTDRHKARLARAR